MTKVLLAPGGIALAFALGLSACTNPYDPGQRAVGGGLIGAGAGAAIGGAAGGGKRRGDRSGIRRRTWRSHRRGNDADPTTTATTSRIPILILKGLVDTQAAGRSPRRLQTAFLPSLYRSRSHCV